MLLKILVIVNLAFCFGFTPEKNIRALSAQFSKITPRIVGGGVAEDRQFPWQAAIYFDTTQGTFFCGGALISNQWLLTAAHCVKDAMIFTIHLGANSLVTNDPHRVTLATVNSVIHPGYTTHPLRNDIGLIKLHAAVKLSDYIQPIALGDDDDVLGEVDVIVSGWGQRGDWDSGVTNDLHFVNLSTITNALCSRVYGNQIVEGMICAVGRGSDSICTGDSGGPLVAYKGGVPVHTGIATFVSSAGCESGDPSGYTRTSTYREWIRATTGV